MLVFHMILFLVRDEPTKGFKFGLKSLNLESLGNMSSVRVKCLGMVVTPSIWLKFFNSSCMSLFDCYTTS